MYLFDAAGSMTRQARGLATSPTLAPSEISSKRSRVISTRPFRQRRDVSTEMPNVPLVPPYRNRVIDRGFRTPDCAGESSTPGRNARLHGRSPAMAAPHGGVPGAG